jgi:hypothetical protein
MKKFALVGLSLLIAGCSYSPSPKFINGNYYMGGDENCQMYSIAGNRILCKDENGTVTGYRSPMTNQDLQMYQFQQQQAQQQINQFNQGMSQFNQNAQQFNRDSQQFNRDSQNSSPRYTKCFGTQYTGDCKFPTY